MKLSNSARLTEHLTPDPPPAVTRYLERLLIPESGRIHVVSVTEIIFVSAAKNYVEVHTHAGSLLHRCSMDALETTLDPTRFVRIHRSTIVALDSVREVRSYRSKRSVMVGRGRELPVSASCLDQLMTRLAGAKVWRSSLEPSLGHRAG